MMNKFHLTEDTAHKSYEQYEKIVDEQVKSGLISDSQARAYLQKAKENYKNLNLNKELDRS